VPDGGAISDGTTATFIERSACISCGGGELEQLSEGPFDGGPVGRFIAEDPWGEHPAPFLRGRRGSYVACRDCGMSFHRYILSPEWNERRFSKWMSQEAIEEFERPYRTPDHVFLKAAGNTADVLQIEQLTRPVRGKGPVRLLDFGCGYGAFLSMCSLYGFESCGVDRSSAKRDNACFARIFAEIEEAETLAPFHALTLFEVLEHLDDPRGLMQRLSGLLVEGGLLVLQTPDCTGVRGIETRQDYNRIHPLEHINGFTPETLNGFAGRLGFAAVSIPYSCVTGDPKKIARTVAKRLVSPLLKPTTRMYFRKV
jgi:SAM-dependent methyltransferase